MRQVVRRFVAVVAAAMVISMLAAPAVGAAAPTWSHRDDHVCSTAQPGAAACASIARSLYRNGVLYHANSPQDLQAVAKPALSVSYTAVGIRTAYGITGTGDPSRVIAIVDAYDNTSAYGNLFNYRATMGLPVIGSCSLSQLASLTPSTATPCFVKVDQNGGTSYPAANSGWANEIDLDLQAASAICPKCSILLVEAASALLSDLGTAVTTASNAAHVLAISNSYGGGDIPGASYPAWDNAAKKGIAVMASTGDGGFGTEFPASSTYVIGVGGTTLQVDANGVRKSETAWSGAGSGCSSYNPAGAWQVISGSPCGSFKAIADVSADADPGSGFKVYTNYGGKPGWVIFGGTSLSSPLVAALYAMQGGYGPASLAPKFAWAPATNYYDVTSGSNGSCSPTVLCTAGTGWDGPTGRGSIANGGGVTQVLTTIAVSPPSASVTSGKTQQFSATALDQYGSAMVPQPAFTWSVGGGGTISTSGLFTATTVGGPYTVTASSGGVNGTASVTVTAVPVLTSISVSPATASVPSGTTKQFSATALDQFGSAMVPQPAFTWSVSGGGSISTSGLFTSTSVGGPYTVTASSGGVNGTASVTVTAPPSQDYSLAVTPATKTTSRGSFVAFTVTITRLNGFSGSVAFSVSGVPAGVTSFWSSNPTTGTSATLNLLIPLSASVGTFPLTFTGTSGALSHTAGATLTIN